MFGYNAQFKRCATDGAKTLRVQKLSATTGVKTEKKIDNVFQTNTSNVLNLNK